MDKNESQLIEEIFNNFQRITSIARFEPGVWMDLDLTIVQLKSLFFIDSKESTNFKNLADALGVTPPSITGIIDRLVEQDLVSRKENPENRRMLVLKVTVKGKELLTKLIEIRKSKMISILGRLSLQDLSDLARISESLVRQEHPVEKPEKKNIINQDI
jgi:DNA-binding MarR family transcriptional regulator